MNKPTVQDIFHRFYPAYLEKYTPSPEQAKAARNIINCKTGAYGANVSICEDCGAVQIHYNSCRNRCCPMCQAVPKEKWMDVPAGKISWMLPISIWFLLFRIF